MVGAATIPYRLKWKKHGIIGQGERSFAGPSTVVYGETSCIVNPNTHCAYVFGGWHDDFNWPLVNPLGQISMLQGVLK